MKITERPWTRHFKDKVAMEILDTINKPISHLVLNRLLPHVDKHNTVYGKQEELAIRANVSVRNFKVGIQELLKKDVVRKVKRGVYMINPQFVIEGDEKNQGVVEYKWGMLNSELKLEVLNG